MFLHFEERQFIPTDAWKKEKQAYYELTWKKIKDKINMGKNREIVEVQAVPLRQDMEYYALFSRN